jgi:hypothetical protein
VVTPGTRVERDTLGGSILGWWELSARRVSEKAYRDQRAHVDGLTADVVAAATARELDIFDGIPAGLKPPRGKRAGHPTTLLQDAVDRRRTQLARRRRGPTPEDLVEAIAWHLRTRRPPGVELAYVEGFLRRHREVLVDLARAELGGSVAIPA